MSDVLVVDPSSTVEGFALYTGTWAPELCWYGTMPQGSSVAMVHALIKRAINESATRRVALVIEDQFFGNGLHSLIMCTQARYRWEVLHALLGQYGVVRVHPALWQQAMLRKRGDKTLKREELKARSLIAADKILDASRARPVGGSPGLDDNSADAINIGAWAIAQVTGMWPTGSPTWSMP